MIHVVPSPPTVCRQNMEQADPILGSYLLKLQSFFSRYPRDVIADHSDGGQSIFPTHFHKLQSPEQTQIHHERRNQRTRSFKIANPNPMHIFSHLLIYYNASNTNTHPNPFLRFLPTQSHMDAASQGADTLHTPRSRAPHADLRS